MRKYFLYILILFWSFTACIHKTNKLTVTTLAGNGKLGSVNGNGESASFSNLMGLATDSAGNVYVADSRNNMIRKINPEGMVSTLAGSGAVGSIDGEARSASFFFPVAVAVGPDGSVYVADTHNSLIRKISPGGKVSTLAGRLATDSDTKSQNIERLDDPYGIAVSKRGEIYFTDWARNLIRKIMPDGKMVTVAGSGQRGSNDGKADSASFYLPEGIAVDETGDLFVTDCYNNLIRKIDTNGMVTTFAGNPNHKNGSKDGKGPAASFAHPCGIALDRRGNIYVADVGNNKIRKVTPDGTVTTFAGSGLRGAKNGVATEATFYRPFGVATDNAGNIYVADYQNNLVRKISF